MHDCSSLFCFCKVAALSARLQTLEVEQKTTLAEKVDQAKRESEILREGIFYYPGLADLFLRFFL